MSERFSTDESSEKPEYGSSLDIVNDYNEIKSLLEWLTQKGSRDNPSLWKKNRYRVNFLLIKHELPPDDPESFKTLKDMATAAFKDMKLKM